MTAPRWFVRALKAENPNLTVIWNESKHRWIIYYKLNRYQVTLVSTVCYRDGLGKDIGFKPLDQRTLYALKRSRWLGEGVGRAQMEIDDANDKLEKEFQDLLHEASRDATIDAHRHFDTTSVDLGAGRPYRFPKENKERDRDVIFEDELIDVNE